MITKVTVLVAGLEYTVFVEGTPKYAMSRWNDVEYEAQRISYKAGHKTLPVRLISSDLVDGAGIVCKTQKEN